MAILRTANNIDIIEQIKDFRPFDLFDKPLNIQQKRKKKYCNGAEIYTPIKNIIMY